MDSDEEYQYSDNENEDYTYSYSDNEMEDAGNQKSGRTSDLFVPGRDEDIRIIDTKELRALMDEVVGEISGVMALPPSAATALLRFFSWNKEKLFDKYYSDPESVTSKVGDLSAAARMGQSSGPGGGGAGGGAASLLCRICCDEIDGATAFALGCAHFFCRVCWAQYLDVKVAEGPACVYTVCPEQKCPRIVTEEIFQEFLSAETFLKYQQFSLDSFVDINRTLRWCPGAGCPRAARAPPQAGHVKCVCGAAFCFRCADEAHAPAGCKDLQTWKEKCQNESETANWILANTKRCPKCSTRIEKNQGCNHMTCRQCKEEFCWICMGPWSDHGANTGGYYKCNRYEGKAPAEDNDVARAQAELDKYLHYYQRYHNHHAAQQYAEKQQAATERRMVELQEASAGSTWIDVQFLKSATDQLIECRRALKYTYVYGYYLPDSSPHKTLFEDHQENLEKFTEHLSGLSELPFDKMERTEVINYTRVTGKFLSTILKSVQEGVGDDGSTDETKGGS
uniref:RBR-type E3 ubiquitin transferase n=1 Tax=Heterosigma akashiwo TaxID=2829 RepID=A0A6S9ISQ1_HETAK|mmetsp:Transcript_31423/g.49374  ORF Transcript_31423/g.49374 Transcript_31423/m.49374 type:complete len:509 (+) Transcript_31423:155-1681(+)|eukprot:CAMPEP_0194711762 /NCGR_PEP_ID=MMETSP0296-20130528/4028_1 /TAXON_ID=39354 /ORGANISM="Heterosigma akashiwo, Strain CCMP2393" /LENGTH=508 /DNA_ID=CAMNT_0039609945 /DNA_START=56 /DNA_END=1582 /DNA_ORIENTATION=-